MHPDRFTVTKAPDVVSLIASLPEKQRAQIENDLKKLEVRGLRTSKPLVKHFEDDIYYVRSKCRKKLFRTFYFRDGAKSFYAFCVIEKDTRRLTRRQKSEIRQKYQKAPKP